MTHRLSYLIYKGEIHAKSLVCHTCDRPACCNPDHLWLGTNSENIQDAVQKGRMGGKAKKEKEAPDRYKNSGKSVEELRALAEKYKETQWDYWLNIAMPGNSVRLGTNYRIVDDSGN